MWWVKQNPDQSRGGFQNRDVGRTNFDDNYGPDYGVNYARLADTPNFARDARLSNEVARELLLKFPREKSFIEVNVKNGFVFLKGDIPDEAKRTAIINHVSFMEGVREVINELHSVTM